MNTAKFSLEGKVALVTGGSRGIGRASALAFADAGADIALTSWHLADLERVAAEVGAMGRRALPVASDVAQLEQSKDLVGQVARELGRSDILMNNAAIMPWNFGLLMDLEESEWDIQVNVNLKGAFFLSPLVARMMREQGGGSIINISSVQGFRPFNNVYAITEAAIIMLTKSMAQEWGQ